MVVEFTVISLLPPLEAGMSLAAKAPMQIYQRKMFNTDNLLPEEYINHKGKKYDKYSIVKLEGDYYKLKIPYKELKEKYFDKLEIKGLDAKRSNYTNI